MYAKAKIPKRYRPEPSARIQSLDLLDRLIQAALVKMNLPHAVLTSQRVERCEFETGHHNGAPNGWKHWERIVAFRPEGYTRWYRPDLSQWVADPLEGFRKPSIHVTAPEHRSYVRAA